MDTEKAILLLSAGLEEALSEIKRDLITIEGMLVAKGIFTELDFEAARKYAEDHVDEVKKHREQAEEYMKKFHEMNQFDEDFAVILKGSATREQVDRFKDSLGM